MGYFVKLADKGLYGCMLVVVAGRQKRGLQVVAHSPILRSLFPVQVLESESVYRDFFPTRSTSTPLRGCTGQRLTTWFIAHAGRTHFSTLWPRFG